VDKSLSDRLFETPVRGRAVPGPAWAKPPFVTVGTETNQGQVPGPSVSLRALSERPGRCLNNPRSTPSSFDDGTLRSFIASFPQLIPTGGVVC
jgi:hypothetical protein